MRIPLLLLCLITTSAEANKLPPFAGEPVCKQCEKNPITDCSTEKTDATIAKPTPAVLAAKDRLLYTSAELTCARGKRLCRFADSYCVKTVHGETSVSESKKSIGVNTNNAFNKSEHDSLSFGSKALLELADFLIHVLALLLAISLLRRAVNAFRRAVNAFRRIRPVTDASNPRDSDSDCDSVEFSEPKFVDSVKLTNLRVPRKDRYDRASKCISDVDPWTEEKIDLEEAEDAEILEIADSMHTALTLSSDSLFRFNEEERLSDALKYSLNKTAMRVYTDLSANMRLEFGVGFERRVIEMNENYNTTWIFQLVYSIMIMRRCSRWNDAIMEGIAKHVRNIISELVVLGIDAQFHYAFECSSPAKLLKEVRTNKTSDIKAWRKICWMTLVNYIDFVENKAKAVTIPPENECA